jgi:hypothetical protein
MVYPLMTTQMVMLLFRPNWRISAPLTQIGEHMGNLSPPSMISVLSSTAGVLGFLLTSARGFRAFDRNGNPIGYFSDKEQAVRAVRDTQDPMEGLYVDREYYGPQ